MEYLEESQRSFPYRPFPPIALTRKQDFLGELAAPCARFKSPLSRSERARVAMSGKYEEADIANGNSFSFTSGIPANWQLLVRYLYQEKMAGQPSFEFVPMAADAPKVLRARLAPADHGDETDGRPVLRKGFGSGRSMEESMSKAVGELLERYCLTIYRTRGLLEASFEEMRQRHRAVLDVSDINGYLPFQYEAFPELKRSDSATMRWVPATELLSGTPAYIPAQLAYRNYRFKEARMEPQLMETTSSGSAGHFTRDEAVLASLLEVIERDGFLIQWLNSLSPKEIDLSTISDPGLAELLAYMERYGLEYHVLDTTSDIGIPSCCCVIIDRSGEPAITLGGAAGFDAAQIIAHGFNEALVTLAELLDEDPYRLASGYKPFLDRDLGRDERMRIWSGRQMMERFSFFLGGPAETVEEFMRGVSATGPQEALAFVFDRLRTMGNGYEVYCYEAKHRVLDTLGYHVVKVVVPRLVPLYLNEHLATLDAPRLQGVPPLLGQVSAKAPNPWPHLYP